MMIEAILFCSVRGCLHAEMVQRCCSENALTIFSTFKKIDKVSILIQPGPRPSQITVNLIDIFVLSKAFKYTKTNGYA